MAQEPPRTIRIATRESQLALWQANYLADRLRQIAGDREVTLVPTSTIGDRDRSGPLREMGGQGVFTREIQHIVLEENADIAVHSLKDLPTVPTDGLVLAGVPERAPRFDALLLPDCQRIVSLDEIPEGAKIGTGSPRRQSQLLSARSDLVMAEIRGNVQTRIRKMDEGEYDAIVLAEAGLRRLELDERISLILAPPLMLPAVGQAALGIECRTDDEEVIELLQQITNAETMAEVTAERACMATLQAGCHAPVGVHCQSIDGQLQFTGVVLSPDGSQRFDVSLSEEFDKPFAVGQNAAEELMKLGASSVL